MKSVLGSSALFPSPNGKFEVDDSLIGYSISVDRSVQAGPMVRVPLCQSILNSYPMNWKLKMANSQLSVRIGKQQNRETPIRNKMELLGQRDR